MNAVALSLPTPPDLNALKQRQQAAWSSGNYAVVGTTLQIVGERLAEAVDLRWDERVLDVAAGNGNATLAAARRGGQVVSTDYVPALLGLGQARADAEQLQVAFTEADAEALPFADGSFDVVLSTFGVMFTPDHARAAHELARVCRPGGRIGLANWTPEGFIGQMFKVLGRHIMFNFRYRDAAHMIDVFRTWYGPVQKAFQALPADKAAELEQDLHALMDRMDRGNGNGLVIPSEYLEIVVVRR